MEEISWMIMDGEKCTSDFQRIFQIFNNHDLIQWQASEGGKHLGLGIQRVFYAYAHYYCTLMLLNGTCE